MHLADGFEWLCRALPMLVWACLSLDLRLLCWLSRGSNPLSWTAKAWPSCWSIWSFFVDKRPWLLERCPSFLRAGLGSLSTFFFFFYHYQSKFAILPRMPPCFAILSKGWFLSSPQDRKLVAWPNGQFNRGSFDTQVSLYSSINIIKKESELQEF